MTVRSYPDLAKWKREDALVPDPQEFDMSDPDQADQARAACASAAGRLGLFERFVIASTAEKSN